MRAATEARCCPCRDVSGDRPGTSDNGARNLRILKDALMRAVIVLKSPSGMVNRPRRNGRPGQWVGSVMKDS